MNRTITMITATIFAGSLAIPAFAQVGAGVAGNATVGDPTMHAGANADVANSDAERAEPAAPINAAPPTTLHLRHRDRVKTSETVTHGIDVSGSTGASRSGVNANSTITKSEDTATGGY